MKNAAQINVSQINAQQGQYQAQSDVKNSLPSTKTASALLPEPKGPKNTDAGNSMDTAEKLGEMGAGAGVGAGLGSVLNGKTVANAPTQTKKTVSVSGVDTNSSISTNSSIGGSSVTVTQGGKALPPPTIVTINNGPGVAPTTYQEYSQPEATINVHPSTKSSTGAPPPAPAVGIVAAPSIAAPKPNLQKPVQQGPTTNTSASGDSAAPQPQAAPPPPAN